MTPQEFPGVSRDKEAVRERALIRRNLRKLVLPRELALPFTFMSIDMCSLIWQEREIIPPLDADGSWSRPGSAPKVATQRRKADTMESNV